MFDNIGGKIKGLAKFMTGVGIAASWCVCISFLVTGDEVFALIGVGIGIVGSLLSWVSAFLLYGFGQLVENSDILAGRKTLEEIEDSGDEQAPPKMVSAPRAVAESPDSVGAVEEVQMPDEFTGPEDPVLAEKLENLEMRFAKGQITQEAYEQERELLLKQAKWFNE
ncbi:MAG: SHOCT domain-containing protein [Ruminococcaceae bacterium]|nr:SHOCT domain-containing protein [Oscillospiraceae bacterium]